MLRVLMVLALAALLAGAAFVYLHFDADLDRAHAAVAGGRLADTSAGPIEYAEAGAGTPLLSIHGAGGGYDQGLANARGFVGDTHRIIAPSRFGYLATPVLANASVAAQADAHAALLDHLGVAQAIVIGVSAGARSAAELAIRHPARVRALILIVPAGYSPDSPVTIQENRGNRFTYWAVNSGGDFAWWAAERVAPDVLVRFVGVPPALLHAAPPQAQREVMDIVASIQPLSRRFRGINIDSTPEPGEPALDRIAAPTLLISARDDLFNTLPAAEYAASRTPNAKLIAFETGGHLLVGRGEQVRAEIRAFLAEVEAR